MPIISNIGYMQIPLDQKIFNITKYNQVIFNSKITFEHNR